MPIDDDAFEDEQHAIMDATLARMRKTDRDLDRIFKIGFSDARTNGLDDQLRQQVEEYAGVTHSQGRLIDYHRLFAGLDADR